MKRYGSVIQLRKEHEEAYRALHQKVWPDVLKMISDCQIRNYSIFLRDGFLFSYFEYHGNEYKADMEKMAADPVTQDWWAICMPFQKPVSTAAPDEWWAPLEEVFHHD